MKIRDNIVIFKSSPVNFRKEQLGHKANTVRVLTQKEHETIQKNLPNVIEIHKVGANKAFSRNIEDITIFKTKQLEKGYYLYIFSWGG